MIPILFENEEIIIIDKPAGLPSQPGEGVHDDVIMVLERQCGHRFLPVHRLDKETAGCMILAKDSVAARRWSEFISGKVVGKRYFAWVAGQPATDSGSIETELEGNRGAQRAKTLWFLLETWSLPLPDSDPVVISLLEIELRTGRMHQIRRHLAGIGHPILADDRHGDFALNKALRRARIKRLMLWARELVLPPTPSLPGGASILSSEPPHFVALREMLSPHIFAQIEDSPREDTRREDAPHGDTRRENTQRVSSSGGMLLRQPPRAGRHSEKAVHR